MTVLWHCVCEFVFHIAGRCPEKSGSYFLRIIKAVLGILHTDDAFRGVQAAGGMDLAARITADGHFHTDDLIDVQVPPEQTHIYKIKFSAAHLHGSPAARLFLHANQIRLL